VVHQGSIFGIEPQRHEDTKVGKITEAFSLCLRAFVVQTGSFMQLPDLSATGHESGSNLNPRPVVAFRARLVMFVGK